MSVRVAELMANFWRFADSFERGMSGVFVAELAMEVFALRRIWRSSRRRIFKSVRATRWFRKSAS